MVKARRPVDEQSAAEPASEGITPQGDPRGNAFSAAQISAQREPFGLDRVSVLESFSELMGEDLTGVSLQTGSAGVGATGVARGEHVTVASSADPFDPEGLALIGHELVHVLQQRKGRVDPEHPDPELEIEAETLGRKAAAGIPVRVAAGSLPRAVAPQHFRPQDWVKSFYYDETKLATGLTSREKEVADRLVADAKALVAPWDEARLDPEVAFDPTPLENAFRGAKREWILETGREFDEIESYVVAELRLTGFEQRLREIRAFHVPSLVSWADAFGLGPTSRQHVYTIELLEGTTGGGGGLCVKGEEISRRYKLTYTNPELPELTWSTELWVELGNMGLDTSVCKPWITGGSDLPGSTSTTKPQMRYRPPSWFESCPAGMVSVGASEVTGVVGVEASTLFLGEDSDTLFFDSELGLSLKIPAPGEDMLKNKDITSWKDLIPSGSATVAAGIAGTDTTAMDSSWDMGEIGTEERSEGPEDWMLVHVAKLYFETGEGELDGHGYDTIAEIVERMMIYDATHPGAEFALHIQGGASNLWGSVQSDIDKLVAQRERGEIDEETWRQRYWELDAERELNNELLANERAGAVHYALSAALLDMQSAHIMEEAISKSDTSPETIDPEHLETMGVGEDSNYAYDRAVKVSIFYRVPPVR